LEAQMRTLSIAAAILAFSAAGAVSAQDAHWGDSGVAIYNVPMGYGSQAELNGSPGNFVRDRKKKRSKRIGHVPGACAFEGTSLRPDAAEYWGVSQGTCGGPFGIGPAQDDRMGGTLTVVTTGAWDTAIVETRDSEGAHQPEALNGGLDLD
jgi:hypothetical protein